MLSNWQNNVYIWRDGLKKMFIFILWFVNMSGFYHMYVTEKGPLAYFFSLKCLYFYFLNVHYFKIILWNCSRIAVTIGFLWGPQHSVYAAASFSANVTLWCSRNDTQLFTSVICIWTSYLSHSDCWVVILKFYTVPIFFFARSQKLCNPTKISSKHVSTILPRKYDDISQLRHSYTKGPFAWLGSYY